MVRQWWIESKNVGKVKKRIYQMLQWYCGFGTWHVEPINNRPYGLEIVRTLNKLIDRNIFNRHIPIVEVGCGLGDIISGIKWKYGKFGYDISTEVLKGGRILHPSVRFKNGTFDDIGCGEINCLIMVDFIHMIPHDKLKKKIDIVLKNNRVKMFVMDIFVDNEGTEYTYSHSGEYLFGEQYRLARRSKAILCAHGAKRYIEYWMAVKQR